MFLNSVNSSRKRRNLNEKIQIAINISIKIAKNQIMIKGKYSIINPYQTYSLSKYSKSIYNSYKSKYNYYNQK